MQKLSTTTKAILKEQVGFAVANGCEIATETIKKMIRIYQQADGLAIKTVVEIGTGYSRYERYTKRVGKEYKQYRALLANAEEVLMSEIA